MTSREVFLSLPPLSFEECDAQILFCKSLLSTLDLPNLNSKERSSFLSLLAKYFFQCYLKGDRLGYTNLIKNRISETDQIPVNKKII